MLTDDQLAVVVAGHPVTAALAKAGCVDIQAARSQKYFRMRPSFLPAVRCVGQHIREDNPAEDHFSSMILLNIPAWPFRPAEAFAELFDLCVWRQNRIQGGIKALDPAGKWMGRTIGTQAGR